MAKREHIKDLSYFKYFLVYFRYGSDYYAFAKPEHKYTFVPLEATPSFDLEAINIIKFKTKEEAKEALSKIPPFEYDGNEPFLDTIENTYLWDLL